MTSRVASPPFIPNKISVFKRSPTIIVRFGSKLTLDRMMSRVYHFLWVDLLGLHAIKHSTGWLSCAHGITTESKAEWSANWPCSRKQTMSTRISAIFIRRYEETFRIAGQELKCLWEFCIIYLGIKAAYNGSYVRIQSEISQIEGSQRIISRILAKPHMNFPYA